MYSLRKWLYKPKRSDCSLLAQFFYADEDLNAVATELDSFDGRKDPERCTLLVNQLRYFQDRVLTIVQRIMDEVIPGSRANRDFRVKFPDDLVQDALGAQLWFGAECLAAGSCILNREVESASMRPLAKAMTKSLDSVRSLLRDQCLKNQNMYSDRLRQALVLFDRLFAEFELSYVSVMVPVKTMKEYDTIQEVTVLFSEAVLRALRLNLLTQDMLDDYDPALMFTIPRLAIICGLIMFPEGPLNPDRKSSDISEMFRPFQPLLIKIRELLWTLSAEELLTLERSLCSAEEPGIYRDIATSAATSQSQLASNSKTDYSVPVQNLLLNASTPPSALDFCHRSDSLRDGSGDGSCEADSAIAGVGEAHAEREVDENESSDSGMPSDNESIGETAEYGLGARPKKSQSTQTETDKHQQNSLRSVVIEENDTTPTTSYTTDVELSESDLNQTSCNKSLHETNYSDEVVRRWDDTTTRSVAVSDSSDSSQADTHGDCDMSSFVADMRLLCRQTVDLTTDCLECEADPVVICRDIVEGIVLQAMHAATKCRSRHASHSSRHFSFNLPLPDLRPVLVERSPSLDGAASRRFVFDRSTSFDRSVSRVNSSNEHTLHSGESSADVQPVQFYRDREPPPLRTAQNGSRDSLRVDSSHGMGGNSENMTTEEQVTRLKQQVRVPVSGQSSRHNSGQRLPSVGHTENSSVQDCEAESGDTSETSSYTSESHDQEEIALAVQAAEVAVGIRNKFRDREDLIHRLFVCISGVADQLQTNYACDFRNILKIVFELHCTEPLAKIEVGQVANESLGQEEEGATGLDEEDTYFPTMEESESESSNVPGDPPEWLPDTDCTKCCACQAPFTFIRRRHHCRNCGMIFCSRCSSNFVPLPQYGHAQPVRVCNLCFMFQVTPFTMEESPE